MHITHPYLLMHPITGIYDFYISAKRYPWNAAVLFDGIFYQAGVKPLPWYYLPKTMFITIPLTTLILFCLGNIFLFFRIHSRKKLGDWYYVLLTFYIPLFLDFLLRPTLYDSWRHFLFLTAPLIIIAMYGLRSLLEKRGLYLRLIILLLVVIGLISIAAEMIRLHPYEYIYYNSLTGGLKGTYGKYETDYWGEGSKEAVAWFNKNLNDPRLEYKFLVEGDPLASSYYFRPNMVLTTDETEANYIITLTRWNLQLRHPGKVVFIVQREGVPLIYLKEVKKPILNE